jgi:hypothetical protein
MSASTAKGLVFSGLEKGAIPWTLLGFIVLSACVHAIGFFMFQTIYPPEARMGPPPVQVGLLTPGTPEADAILHWINSEDPALAAEPSRAPIPGLTSLPYIPSYASVHARPVMAQAPEAPLPYPPGVAGLDLVKLAAAHPVSRPAPPAPSPTSLSLSGDLANAPHDPLPPMDGLREGDPSLGALEPARFLIGVNNAGEVRYSFIQDASGDKTLDTAAAALLQRVHFKAISAPLTWGFATFYWGASTYAQPPAITGTAS